VKKTMPDNPTVTNTSTELARERSREAAERTLMAWIRTSLALIGFGFTIAKFYDYLEQTQLRKSLDPIHSHLLFGGSYIGLGILSLLAAVIQHRRILKQIEHDQFVYTGLRPLSMFVAIVLLLTGVFAFAAILL
jgi:putative membrane protein